MFYSNRSNIKIYGITKRNRHQKIDYDSLKQKKITFTFDIPEQADCVIPVPSSCTFSLRLAKKTNLPFGATIKKKLNKKISHIPIHLRKSVGKELFEITGDIKNKTILLTDDISTTGATLNSIAGILLELGAKKVIGLVYFLNK